MSTDHASRLALLSLARQAIANIAINTFTIGDVELLNERRGAFVTLTKHERLRGCVGRVEPDAPLRVLVPEMARAAAYSDPRFPAVRAEEVAQLTIEISLLSVPELVTDAAHVEVGRHGLMVSARGRRGLLLPQVPLQYGWSREDFLDETCVKAGLPADAWRDSGVRIHAFTAEVFAEDDE